MVSSVRGAAHLIRQNVRKRRPRQDSLRTLEDVCRSDDSGRRDQCLSAAVLVASRAKGIQYPRTLARQSSTKSLAVREWASTYRFVLVNGRFAPRH